MDTNADSQTRPVVAHLDHVVKRYARGTLALDGLSLSIRESEFVALLGPSGCGKSTVLRLIAGLTQPSEGQVGTPSLLRATGPSLGGATERIGFVFQEPTLMPWSDVADNVALPLKLQHRDHSETRDRVHQALALVGLEKFAHAFPRELSGGMRMRVSLARAMITRPKLLLLDEPFAALDEITRAKLNDDLLALWASHGLTVVFVTHSVYESVYLSSRIVVMSGRPGRVFAEQPVTVPYPRDEHFRTSAEYGHLCQQTSSLLRHAQPDR